MKYFEKTMTFDEAQATYRNLLKKHHSDITGGDDEICIEVINEYKSFINSFSKKTYEDYEQAQKKEGKKYYKPETSVDKFAEILTEISKFNMTIEIIGSWIYARQGSFYVKEELKKIGFWFSKKHKAWIFSGTKKRNWGSGLKIDEIRGKFGNEFINKQKVVTA